MQIGLRPVLMPSRWEDPAEKVGFADDHWTEVAGGHGTAEVSGEAIYLTVGLRNVGNGLAVLHGWSFYPERLMGIVERPDPATFRRLTRDLYVPAGDRGFWQGSFRDGSEPGFADARDAITAGRAMTVDLLYGDHQGGQRTISRFTLTPGDDGSRLAACPPLEPRPSRPQVAPRPGGRARTRRAARRRVGRLRPGFRS